MAEEKCGECGRGKLWWDGCARIECKRRKPWGDPLANTEVPVTNVGGYANHSGQEVSGTYRKKPRLSE